MMPPAPASDADPEQPLRLRRSGFVAGTAFMLFATSLFLSWWVVSNSVDGSTTPLAAVSPLGDGQGITHGWARGLSAGLVIAASAGLFLRVASRGWVHEPHVWRRDLGILSILGLGALASPMLWPAPLGNLVLPFWGGRSLVLDNGTGQQLTLLANPGIGWVVALVATLLCGAAWWMARPGHQEIPGPATTK